MKPSVRRTWGNLYVTVKSWGFKLSLIATVCAFPLTVSAQQMAAAEAASSAATAATSPVPQVVTYTGTASDANGEPLTSVIGVTFLLYKDSQGGAPLWMETQNVHPDEAGHYSVMLGSTTSQGLPQDVFVSGEARWLGVQIVGEQEQPRVLLVAVPYALKAGDAETVGGLPPSAFVLANSAQGNRPGTKPVVAADSTAAGKNATPPANPAVTGKGVVDFIPMWDATNDIIDSLIFQKSSSVGIATTAPAATLDVNGKSDVRDTLTLFPKGTDSTLAVNGTTFKIDQTGKVNFVTGQTFPGTGTITGVTTATGSGLTGGGTKGTLALGLTKTCSAKQILQWNGTSWACSAAGSGTITGVTTASGSGLTGGGASGSLNLSLTTSCSSGQTLAWNGSVWVCKTVGGSGTVTSVGLSAPSSDFTVTGSPVTASGTLGLNWNVAPTSGNTANAIVKRDSTSSFNINNISAAGEITVGSTLTTVGNATFFSPVGIGTSAPQALLNLDYNGTANRDSILVGNNSTKGLQLRDTGGAVDLESLGVPLFVNYATGQSTYLFNLVGVGTSNPQVELNLDQGDTATNDALLIGNYNKGLQLRDTGAAVDLESIGVPLYVNNVTQQNLYLNPSGIISDPNNPNYGYGGVAIGSANPTGFYPLTVSGGCCTSQPYAAIFWGFTDVEADLAVIGNLTVLGNKNFRIDHPLDPKNKYLQHAAIESSEVLNQYSGNVVLDDNGEGRVEFPTWFAAINEDFRYQLTAIGAPGPSLYVSEEMKDNSFTIAGGRSGMKVSWQVTARRNDAYMKAHPYVVEQDKPEFERGYYTLPELYGAPKEEGIRYAQEQRSKEQQSKTTAPVKVKK